MSLYRSPSQTLDDFETFSKIFELNLENMVQGNPFLVVVTGDFNAKSSKWHSQYKSTLERNVIDNITSQYTFPEFIFRNHMSHENEVILRKSISDERN